MNCTTIKSHVTHLITSTADCLICYKLFQTHFSCLCKDLTMLCFTVCTMSKMVFAGHGQNTHTTITLCRDTNKTDIPMPEFPLSFFFFFFFPEWKLGSTLQNQTGHQARKILPKTVSVFSLKDHTPTLNSREQTHQRKSKHAGKYQNKTYQCWTLPHDKSTCSVIEFQHRHTWPSQWPRGGCLRRGREGDRSSLSVVESYQWCWLSSGYPAGWLALQGQCWDWLIRHQCTKLRW